MTTRDIPDVAVFTTILEDEPVVHYYDQHPTEEDLMGESAAQSQLIFYLLKVLEWLARGRDWFVINDINIYRTRQRYEYPLAPGVAVFKGGVVPNRAARTMRSWRLYEQGRTPPQVVFEICSDTTWKDDVNRKPAKYATLGVNEYFAYDPNDPPYWPKRQGRLRGWRLREGVMVEQTKDAQGRLWSDELASWLVADGAFLRLYDAAGRLRLTEGEAERAAKEAERVAKEAERAAKEAAQTAEANERAAKEAAWAKLRELGIDPSKL